MPKCTNCGERNLENSARCVKCGVGLGQQVRAREDAQRAQIWKVVRVISWIVTAIIVVVLIPRAYHAGGAAYFRYRMTSLQGEVEKDCGGPVTATMAPYQKDQIQPCIAKSEPLQEATKNYEDFTKGDK